VPWSEWLALIGSTAIGVALVVMGLLSQRMGKATRSGAYYIGFFIAVALVGGSVIARLLRLLFGIPSVDPLPDVWVLVYDGLPALGITLGVIVAWRYWSWLLAERD
jgi:hypothetical protein